MRESTVETRICKWAGDFGIKVLKLSGRNQNGQPDRLFLKHGKAVFIEFKKPGEDARDLQKKWKRDLNNLGFTAEICDTIPGAMMVLREAFKL